MAQNSPRALAAIAADWVCRRADGLSASEDAELAAWLAADQRHSLAYERASRTWALMDRPFEANVASVLVETLAKRRQQRVRCRAAAVICGAVAVLALFTLGPSGRFVPSSATPTAILAEARRQVLPDGSVVEFKADAGAEVEFVDSARRVRLVDGEAHFQVMPDADRPFIVMANGVEVRAVGTAFSVLLESQSVEVLVTEGRVSVDPVAVPAPRSLVDAGNRAVVSTAKAAPQVAILPVSSAEQERSLAWRYPRLEFSGTPLAVAVRSFNRQAPRANSIHLVVGDPDLAQVEVSGFFRIDNVEGFVRLLEASFGVRGERVSEHTIILRRVR